MKKTTAFLACIFFAFQLLAQDWKMVSGRITTTWGENVNPQLNLTEYPRPQMTRDRFMILNGLWKYALLPVSSVTIPSNFTGNILVPFAVESALSGVSKTVGKDSVIWCQRSISLPSSFTRDRILLHFGAVDWMCDVFVNGQKVGSHRGGYDPFYFDITQVLKKSRTANVSVRVWDPTDDGPQPRGKQVKNPHAIWYTPVSGIWQTVWLESVPQTYISNTRQTPDIDKQEVRVSARVENARPGDQLRLTAWDESRPVAEKTIAVGEEVSLPIPGSKLWSPSDPFLYDLKISLLRKGKVVDEVGSYFAMRKISMMPDKNGIQRMMLNNRFLFQYGPLDQGWWPDGLYTAPTDEALKFDIVKTKEMGFNMIRKHVKVEPARWYYHCDKLGMLVWQDMPSGDLGNRWESRPGVYGRSSDKQRTQESEEIFRQEWKEIMNDFYNFPSIVVWVPFNEAWGQFKTREITEWTMQLDPSRLVNSASGGNFEPVGHIMDLHNYPDPAMPHPDLFGSDQILVLGEFGGLGLPVEGHTWQDKNNWGYQSFKNREELLKRYSEMMDRLPHLIEKGLSAAVYTQTTDVEIETNGLMTYDRKVVKFPEARLKEMHDKLTRMSLPSASTSSRSDGWMPLFDGKTLENWRAGENPSTFSVEDGMIKVHGPRAHLFYEGPAGAHHFKNFELKMQVKTMSGSNSGIFFHTAFQDKGWPAKGYEVQVNNSHTDWRRTGSLYGVDDVREVYVQDGEWYTEYIKVEGKKVTVKINDRTVVEYTEPEGIEKEEGRAQKRLSAGTIALQGHDPQSIVYFKDVMIRILPD